MKTRFGRTIAAAVLAALYPAGAFAQSDLRPPPADVSGPARQTAARDKLNVTIDIDEAYDQNVVVQASNTPISLFQGSGPYTMLTPSLDFSSRGDHLQVGITAGSNVRYYGDTHETVVTNHSVGAGITGRLSPATSVSFNEGFTYSPALLYGLFATVAAPALGDTVPSASNYALNDERSYASITTASLTHQITPRAAVSFSANYRVTDFSGSNSSYADVHGDDEGGRFTYSLSRGLGVRLGYTFRRTHYENLPGSTEHDFDFGIDYSRALSRTRKSIVAVSLGPAVVTGPLVNGSLEIRRQYRLVADASLKRQIGRTWNLQGTYHRGMGYIEGFQSPVFTAAYAATAGGFLTRRTDLSMSAAYSTGESALTGAPSQFTTYTGNVRLNFAADRRWNTYVEYVLYYYEFNQTFALPTGVPPGLTRNGLRTGVVLRLPEGKR